MNSAASIKVIVSLLLNRGLRPTRPAKSWHPFSRYQSSTITKRMVNKVVRSILVIGLALHHGCVLLHFGDQPISGKSISHKAYDRKFIQKVRRTDRYYQMYINDVKREIPHLRNREEYEALRMFINWGVTSGWSPPTTGKEFSFMLNDIRKNNASIPFILSELFSTEEFSRWQPCFVERYTCISCGNDTKIWTEADADIMKDGECRLCSNHDSLTGRDTTYRLGHLGTKSRMELRTYLSGLSLPKSRIIELLGDLH